MRRMRELAVRPAVWAAVVGLTALSAAARAADDADTAAPLTVVVMDPLSGPLSCDCVKGYAQRKYEVLGEYLEARLGRPVKVVWSASLPKALEGEAAGRADLIIGKDSVVRSDAEKASLEVSSVAMLTGKDGATTQTGLIVVRKNDPAKTAADLKGYRVLFGPADCDEKHAAPMDLLKASGVTVSAEPETAAACSEAATKILEMPADARAAAVISSYAQPLLEGCGTINKGDLRIVGESKAVPFITAFVTDGVSPSDRQEIVESLLSVGGDPLLCLALETKAGFVKADEKTAAVDGKKK